MTFLTGAFLTASALAAVPILVHLLARQKVREIEWAAFQFLMGNDATKNSRSIKLNDLLLMLVRTLVLLALVFAFAQPLIDGAWFRQHAIERVLILDASLSMAASVETDEFGEPLTALTLAKQTARAEIESLGAQDQLRVMLLDGRPRWLTDSAVLMSDQNRKSVLSQIDELEAQPCRSDFNDAVRAVLRTPLDDRCRERQIQFIYDGTANPVDRESIDALRKQLEQNATPSRVAVRSVRPDQSALGNLFVETIRPDRDLIAAGETVRVSIEVSNGSQEVVGSMKLVLLADQREIASTTLSGVEAGSKRNVRLRARLDEPGFTQLTAQVVDLPNKQNRLGADDKSTCVVHVVERIPVLVVDGEIVNDQLVTIQDGSESGFLVTALGGEDKPQKKGGRAEPLSAFRPVVIGPDAARKTDLSNYAAVIWLNAGVPEDEQWTLSVLDFLNAGGGFWMVLGENNVANEAERSATNAFLAAANWGTLQASSLRERDDAEETSAANVLLFDSSHPVPQLFAQKDIQANRLRVTRAIEIENSFLAAADTLLAFTDGQPLLLSQQRTNGRFLLQTFGLNRDSSNLPILPLYLPLVQETLSDLVSERFPRVNYSPDEAVQLPALFQIGQLNVTHPNGAMDELTRFERQQKTYRRTQCFGVHEVQLDGEPLFGFSLSRDPDESDLASLEQTARERLVAAGIGWNELPSTNTQATSRSRLAEWLIALGVLLLIAEAFLATRRSTTTKKWRTDAPRNLLGEALLTGTSTGTLGKDNDFSPIASLSNRSSVAARTDKETAVVAPEAP